MMEDYLKRKAECLHDNKPERYIINDVGMGFIVRDKLAHKNHMDDKTDYLLIPELNGGMSKDDKYLTAQDLIDRLNELDYEVNGNLYDDDKYWVLNMKEKIFQRLKQELDKSLNTLENFDTIEFNLVNNDFPNKKLEKISVRVDLRREERRIKDDRQ